MRALAGVLLVATTLASCGEVDEFAQSPADQHDCRHVDSDPLKAIAACSRLIYANDERLMTEASARYHRGLAFEHYRDWQHAKEDYRQALKLNPSDSFAQQRLADMEHDGHITKD